MSETFVRKIENFVCGKCRVTVTGNGYTNHCPKCLWSRHVDIHPGDRLASCLGLMEPIRVSEEGGRRRILHRCRVCQYEKINDTAEEDDFEMILSVMRGGAENS
ncbi:MAG: RNHCP domain-containing protein [Candidatus Moraniibacteriota bacterium]